MQKCIIFGTGELAKKSYQKLNKFYNIVYFTSNDSKTWGEQFFDKPIISISEFLKLKNNNFIVIIASTYYNEIANQLLSIGLSDFYFVEPISLALIEYTHMEPVKLLNYFRNIKKILFVQQSQCIRTYKIASVLAEKGIKVDLAFINKPYELTNSNLESPYENTILINNLSEFLEYVNGENYDIIHSSNEPDYLTNFLLNSNKRVVHDTHDMMSLRSDIPYDSLVNEYNANKNSHSNIYVTESIKDIALSKFKIYNKNILVLNNYILESQKPSYYMEKLSKKDGEIHCVYEGGLLDNIYNHRFLENKFLKIASNRIHVHFYSQFNPEYCKYLQDKNEYLHYEGNFNSQKLMIQLTQYDVGLALLNITLRNNIFLQTAFPNKIFEYINANLPVAVDNIEIMKKFVNEYKVGRYLNFDNDLKSQITDISHIKFEKNFLVDNNLTMNSQANRILEFYKNTLL